MFKNKDVNTITMKGIKDEMNMKNSFNSQFNTKVIKEEECIPENIMIIEKKQGSDN
jgi:hypothetical protein